MQARLPDLVEMQATERHVKPPAEKPPPFVRRLTVELPDDEAERRGYPFSLPAIHHLGELHLHSPVTVFVGENGSGKSTLLEAIAVSLGLNAEGGSKNLRFATRASHSKLHERLVVTRGASRPRNSFFLRAESFYNVASALEEIDPGAAGYGGTPLHHQSHGESFLALFLHRFGPHGLYLLDEPESALSPQRQLALLVRMHELVAAGSQFLIATHAPILMGFPGAQVLQFTDSGLEEVDAERTEHWLVAKRFLADPQSMLRDLLG